MEKSYPDEYFDCFYIWLFFQCCQCCGCYGERSVLMRDKPAVVSRTQVDIDGDNVPDLEVAQMEDGTEVLQEVGSGKVECFMTLISFGLVLFILYYVFFLKEFGSGHDRTQIETWSSGDISLWNQGFFCGALLCSGLAQVAIFPCQLCKALRIVWVNINTKKISRRPGWA